MSDLAACWPEGLHGPLWPASSQRGQLLITMQTVCAQCQKDLLHISSGCTCASVSSSLSSEWTKGDAWSI